MHCFISILQDRGISQKAAAELCGVGQSTVVDWLSGSHPTDPIAIQRLCKSLDVDFEWILTGSISKPEIKSMFLSEIFETVEEPSFSGIFQIAEDKPNWSCVSSSGRNFCATGAKHYSLDKEVVGATGQQLTDFVNSMKEIDVKEDKCIGAVFASGQFKSKNWKEYDAAVKCLHKIDYEVKKPNDVNYFYIKPGEIFSQNNVEAAIATLTAKRNELNPALKEEVENAPVSQRQFELAQAEQKKAEAKIKEPPILSANTYVHAGNKYVGKQFKLKVIGDGIVGLDVVEKGTCGFYLVAGGDTGFSDTGSGTYYITSSDVPICSLLHDIQGQDVSAIDLIGEYRTPVDFTLKNGVTGKAAGFKAIRRY